MSGETDLNILLENLTPALDPVSYVYAVLTEFVNGPASGLTPFATVKEDEGMTVILPLDQAEAAGFDTSLRQRRITLLVHSSLESVGLTAKVSAALAAENIPANMIAGNFHDHVFVPEGMEELALSVLRRLSKS